MPEGKAPCSQSRDPRHADTSQQLAAPQKDASFRAASTEAVCLTREAHPQTQSAPTCTDTQREAQYSPASVGEERQEGKKEFLTHTLP